MYRPGILAAAILHSLSAQPRVIIVSIKGAGAHLRFPSCFGCPLEDTSLDILALVLSRAYVHGFNRMREEKETVPGSEKREQAQESIPQPFTERSASNPLKASV